MKKVKLGQIAALLLLTTTTAQATPLETNWQGLLPLATKLGPVVCPSYPECTIPPAAPQPTPPVGA